MFCFINRFYFRSPVRLAPKLTNTDRNIRHYCEQGVSLPLTNITPINMTPRTSLIDYEHTTRLPTTATTNAYYEDIQEKPKSILSKVYIF